MEMWTWIAVYLVGFVLLQLYLYRHFAKQSTATDSTSDHATSAPDTQASSIDPSESSSDIVICDDCGTHNENHATFTFCRECGGRLQ